MFVQLWLQKTAIFLATIFLIIGGTFTFDQPLLFDVFFFGTLIFLVLTFHKNINIIGVISIIFIATILEHLGWLLLIDSFLSKVFVYLFLFSTLLIIKEEKYRIPIVLFVLIVFSSECYWLLTGYPAPEIYWHLFEINIQILIRHYLLMRVFFTTRLSPVKSRSLDLDYTMQILVAVFMFIHGLTIFEYLIRHFFAIKIVVVWHLSVYIFHLLNLYMLFLIFKNGFKLALESKLSA